MIASDPRYHKILAFFSSSCREEEAKVEQLITDISQVLAPDIQKQNEQAIHYITQQVHEHLKPYFNGTITA